MSRYEGPATIISGTVHNLVTVSLHTDESEPIKSWEGEGEPVEPGFPVIGRGLCSLRLPDGREAGVYVSLRYQWGEDRARLTIKGSGPPPFDPDAGVVAITGGAGRSEVSFG